MMDYISVPSALTTDDLPNLAARIAVRKLLLEGPCGGSGSPTDAKRWPPNLSSHLRSRGAYPALQSTELVSPSSSASPPAAPEPSPTMDQARWFAEEVHPHESALRAYLHSNFPGIHDVDDVVQDSYLNILKARPAGKIGSVRAYLFTTARNAALKVFRKRRIISDIPVNDLPDWRVFDDGQNVIEAANTRLQDALIAEAAAQLPDRCREIFKLRVARGLSHAEIAVQLGISEGTVRVQVARGLTRCVQYLREHGVAADK